MDLNDLLEHLISTSDATSPRELAHEAFTHIDANDYEDVLRKALPEYVRWWLAERRRWRETPETPVPEPLTYAPDDLLSDEGAQIVQANNTKMLKARGSARVTAIRNEWQRHFTDRVWNGERYMLFGEMTAVDLKGAAHALRKQADTLSGKAEYYERIASTLGDAKMVQDLTEDPTRV